jgi:hypothetical protein
MKKITLSVGLLIILLNIILPFGPVQAKSKAEPLVEWKLEPEVLLSGDNATLTITITNTAKLSQEGGGLGSLLPFGSTGSSGGSTYVQRIRLASQNESIDVFSPPYEKAGEISPGQSMKFTFRIKLAENTTDGIYYLNLWAHLSNTDDPRLLIPIRVDNNRKPNLFVTGLESKLSPDIDAYKLSGEINNKGLRNATGATITLKETNPVQPVQPHPVYFIGYLESNGFISFELTYRLKRTNLSPGDKISLVMEYKDEYGRSFEKIEEISFSSLGLTSTAQITQPQQNKGMPAIAVVITAAVVLVIALAILHSWKSYKKE